MYTLIIQCRFILSALSRAKSVRVLPLAAKITLIALGIGILTGVAVGVGVYFGAQGELNSLLEETKDFV